MMATVAVAGCGGVSDPGFSRDLMFWGDAPYADLALGAISRGDIAVAEKYAEKALRYNHRDPYALYAIGLVYENTGRREKARQAYREMLQLKPDGPATVAGPGQLTNLQLTDLVTARLRTLDETAARGGTSVAATSPLPPAFSSASPTAPERGVAVARSPQTDSVGDTTAIRRFEIMRQLVNQGLVSEDEYKARRAQNIGALLPLSSSPPAAGLDRRIPTQEEVSARLQALRAALEQRSITAGEQTAERSMILEGLLPAQPSATAPPTPPPPGIIEAAAMAGRLERLRSANLVTPEEVAKEMEALDRILRGPAPLAGPPSGGDPRLLLPPPAAAGGKAALHLASYKSRALADEGWQQIKSKFPDLLGDLKPKIVTVDLGPRKGKSYRLKAGPLSQSAAEDLCRKLGAKHQYCKAEGY
ncbi:MAG: tetratricopeptide repeat protein [Alphaproteobacteria bacterium]